MSAVLTSASYRRVPGDDVRYHSQSAGWCFGQVTAVVDVNGVEYAEVRWHGKYRPGPVDVSEVPSFRLELCS
jgi:hypothetical protein